ncbi:GTP cyclohydrolase I FolE [bacterium]|nr:GTP cyclohydrolase I FolE [bacterium]
MQIRSVVPMERDNAKDPLEDLVRVWLEEIGEDPDREGLVRTPKRVAKAWRFLNDGHEQNLETVLNDAIFDEDIDEMVMLNDISFFSMCEHHMLPFWGRAHVAYIPNGKVVGLSKIPRIVDMFSRRLQLQERLTQQIAEALQEAVQPRGVAVVTEAQHMCMMMRGVQKVGVDTRASAMLGEFRDNHATRAEFLSMLPQSK